jgi:hypothetical protein
MLTIATSRLLPAGRLNGIEPVLLDADPKLLTAPPVRVTVGGGATGVALSSFESGPGPTAFRARTW